MQTTPAALQHLSQVLAKYRAEAEDWELGVCIELDVDENNEAQRVALIPKVEATASDAMIKRELGDESEEEDGRGAQKASTPELYVPVRFQAHPPRQYPPLRFDITV
ncbi:hypothetical protein DIPPA_26692 [Diplonema papillatum]|nr:hypothetical protein DIPPA_26692 [Diplonema papillatum]